MVTKNSIDNSTTQFTLTIIDPSRFKRQEGLAGTFIEWIYLKCNEEVKRNDAFTDERKTQDAAKEKLEQHKKKISSGLLVSSGQYQIADTMHGVVR